MDTTTRKCFVAFFKPLNLAQTIKSIQHPVISFCCCWSYAAINMDVWPVYSFNATILASDLLDMMVVECAWVAQQERRTTMTKADHTNIIDSSLLAESLES